MRALLSLSGLLAVSFAGIAGGSMFRVVDPPRVRGIEPTIAGVIIQESMLAGISAHLPLAVAFKESRLTHVVSRTNDYGALQVNLPTAIRMGIDPTALADPRNAILIGVNWLAHWQHVCGSEGGAVWAYEHGRCKVR